MRLSSNGKKDRETRFCTEHSHNTSRDDNLQRVCEVGDSPFVDDGQGDGDVLTGVSSELYHSPRIRLSEQRSQEHTHMHHSTHS